MSNSSPMLRKRRKVPRTGFEEEARNNLIATNWQQARQRRKNLAKLTEAFFSVIDPTLPPEPPDFYARSLPQFYIEEFQQPPEISQSCLFIPMVLGAWWMWTRRTARRAMAGFLKAAAGRNISCIPDDDDDDKNNDYYNCSYYPTDKDDPFQSWEEVVNQETTDPSVQFVQWIRGNHDASTICQQQSVNVACGRTPSDCDRKVSNTHNQIQRQMQDKDHAIDSIKTATVISNSESTKEKTISSHQSTRKANPSFSCRTNSFTNGAAGPSTWECIQDVVTWTRDGDLCTDLV